MTNKKTPKIDWKWWKKQVENGLVPQQVYARARYKDRINCQVRQLHRYIEKAIDYLDKNHLKKAQETLKKAINNSEK